MRYMSRLINGSIDCQFPSDLFGRPVDIESDLTCIAVREVSLPSGVATVPGMFRGFFHLEVLSNVVECRSYSLGITT